MAASSLAAPAALGILFFYGLLNNAYVLGQFIQSDSLLPAQLVWDLAHHSYAWRGFQFPRVLSLVPDLLFFAAIQLFGIGWRWGMALLATTISILLAWAGSLVVASLTSVGRANAFVLCTLGVIVTFMPSICAFHDPAVNPLPWMIPLLVIVPVSHGGAFVLSLFAASIAAKALRGSHAAFWSGVALSAIGTFSDLLFIGELLLPLLFAAAAVWRIGAVSFRRAASVWAACAIACGIGWGAQLPLFRQGLPPLGRHLLVYQMKQWAGEWSQLPWAIWSFLLFAIAILIALIRVCSVVRQSPVPATRFRETFYWSFGLSAALTSVIPLTALYIMSNCYRYAMPLLWWPPILLLSLWPTRWVPNIHLLGLLGAPALILPFVLHQPKILHWTTAAASCIAGRAKPLGLDAGLASYWNARTTAASTDWQVQVDQIRSDGGIYIWGNDLASYLHAINDPSRPPRYNFIIVDSELDPANSKLDLVGSRLDPAALLAHYGPPNRVVDCEGAKLWVYSHSLHLIFPSSIYDRLLH